MFYLILGWMVLVSIFGIRSSLLTLKLIRYIRENHPELAKEFGCSKEQRWYKGLKFNNVLYKKQDINDTILIQLKNKARNAQTCVYILMLFLICAMLFLVVIAFLFRH